MYAEKVARVGTMMIMIITEPLLLHMNDSYVP